MHPWAATFWGNDSNLWGIDIVRPIVGVGLLGLSLFMLLGYLSAEIEASMAVKLVSLLVTVGVPGATGGFVLKSHFQGRRRLVGQRDLLKRQTQEAELLRIAGEGERGGKLTVVEVVRDLAMGQEEAEEILKGMALRGVAEIEVTESGLLVYRFPDLNLLSEKSTSKGVLDD